VLFRPSAMGPSLRRDDDSQRARLDREGRLSTWPALPRKGDCQRDRRFLRRV